jgi:hypothetical protein
MFDGFGILYAKQTQFRVSPGRDIEEMVMPDAVAEASWAGKEATIVRSGWNLHQVS